MKEYLKSPLWDDTLAVGERLEYLLGELTIEEKLNCLTTGNPAIERLGIPVLYVGSEAAHGIQARHDQEYDRAEPCYTTVFPSTIGMGMTWDREIMKKAGRVVGTEGRALYNLGRHIALCVWAPTIDMNRDPRWGRIEECYGEDPFLAAELAGAYVDGLRGDDPRYMLCGATAKHFYANNEENGRTYISSAISLRNKYEYYLKPFKKIIMEHHITGVMSAYNEVNGIPCMLLNNELKLLKKWGVAHIVTDGGDVCQTVDIHKYFGSHEETIAEGLKCGIDCFTDKSDYIYASAKKAFDLGMIDEKAIDKALYNYFKIMLELGLFNKNPYENLGIKDVGSEEHSQIARKLTQKSIVMLENDGILPLDNGNKKIAVVGQLSDVWYKGWYTGIPPYRVTPLLGMKNYISKENADIEIVNSQAITEIKIKVTGKDKYLGIVSSDGKMGILPQGEADVFEVDQWEHGKITLRCKRNGKLLRVKDDITKGETGSVYADSDEAFGWYVRERFCINLSGVVITQGEVDSFLAWDGVKLGLDRQGELVKIMSENDGVETRFSVEVVGDGIEAAVRSAKESDIAILCLGSHPMITCKEEIDREDIEFGEYQKRLIEEVSRVNKNVILELISNVPYDLSFVKGKARAVITCANSSMETGNALADIIFGKVSPAGRLNTTWYKSHKDLPAMEDYDIIQDVRTYQYYEGEVLYPFGYGLTYGKFKYSNLTIAEEKEDKKYSTTVEERGITGYLKGSFVVENVGDYASEEVPQVYFRQIASSVKKPLKKLVYFDRIEKVEPGERRVVEFSVPLEELQYFDVITKKMVLEQGEYFFFAGGSSSDIQTSCTLIIDGEKRGCRDGREINEAECFDIAISYDIRPGYLEYQSMCPVNSTKPMVLIYRDIVVDRECQKLILKCDKEFGYDIEVWIGEKKVKTHHMDAKGEKGFSDVEIAIPEVEKQKKFNLKLIVTGKGKISTWKFS